MKLPQKLETNFIKTLQKREIKTDEEWSLMIERDNLIDQQFVFSEEVLQKLICLNEKLLQEEKRIFPIYKEIKNRCEALVSDNLIDDFEIELVVECWNDTYYKKYDESLDGNPFLEEECTYMDFQKGETYVEKDFNYYKDRSYLPEIWHCRTFFELCYHTDLTWFDLCNIDEIWMEIKVRYQFFSDIKKHSLQRRTLAVCRFSFVPY